MARVMVVELERVDAAYSGSLGAFRARIVVPRPPDCPILGNLLQYQRCSTTAQAKQYVREILADLAEEVEFISCH